MVVGGFDGEFAAVVGGDADVEAAGEVPVGQWEGYVLAVSGHVRDDVVDEFADPAKCLDLVEASQDSDDSSMQVATNSPSSVDHETR